MSKSDLLDADKIKAGLKTKCIGSEIIVFKSTASTNEIATKYAKNKGNDGLVIFTEQQTKGRGRAGSKWLSGICDSVLCSIVLTKGKYYPELLSLTCAVAVAEAVDRQAKIKWPNDIILNEKKIAGILVESRQYDENAAFIIGIGVNCHQKPNEFPDELKSTATSIDIETQTTCDRISIAKRLLSSVENCLNIADKNRDEIIEHWRKLSILLGQRTTVNFNRKKFTGNCIGVDPEKGLILRLDKGGVRMFDAVHSSIVK
ncbi:MAG: biotin--[acetyl-CoA-carboxylase] ligase [Planctomycetota bacterium]|jgi:BirA family biotin operon repressor/biotin-[acetyl-CoA-carboxylase] ligase